MFQNKMKEEREGGKKEGERKGGKEGRKQKFLLEQTTLRVCPAEQVLVEQALLLVFLMPFTLSLEESSHGLQVRQASAPVSDLRQSKLL